MVPNPGNPLDFDRYSYVRNNPLKYVDPSCHEICFAEGWCGEYYIDIDALMKMYKIIFSGKWTMAQKLKVLTTGIVIGGKIARITGGTSSDAFSSVFGGVSFVLDNGLTNYYGIASIDSVRLRPDKLTERLIGHELGHVFSRRMQRGAGDKYLSTHPEVMLNSGLWDGGAFMTGENRRIPGSPYQRNGNREETATGYICNVVPCQYHYMKGPKMMDSESNTASEEWADMFLNWSMGGFSSTLWGRFYNDWLTTNMSSWVGMTGGR